MDMDLCWLFVVRVLNLFRTRNSLGAARFLAEHDEEASGALAGIFGEPASRRSEDSLVPALVGLRGFMA